MGNQSVLCPVCQGVLPASGKEAYTALRGRLIVTNGYCGGGCAERRAEEQAQAQQAQMRQQAQQQVQASPVPSAAPVRQAPARPQATAGAPAVVPAGAGVPGGVTGVPVRVAR